MKVRLGFLAVFLFAFLLASTTEGYILGNRWGRTATDGNGLVLGQATTLTWGIVPDGTFIPGEGGSNLVSFLDSIIPGGSGTDLTQRPWFTYFEQSFNRWGELGGLNYVFEAADDGAQHGGAAGALGVRADVRIGGQFIDGPNGILAYNSFPNNGDMVIDTGDNAFFGNSNSNYLRLRNTVMHEHGHGMGLSHIESNSHNFLMEPFLSTSFDGPQLDDIRGMQRGYGDQYEQDNNFEGNDVIANASDLGTVADGSFARIGFGGRFAFVPTSRTGSDFVSIDDNSDIDFFAFSVDGRSDVQLTVSPVGVNITSGPQGGSQSAQNTRLINDLNIELWDTDQSTMLASDNSGGLGEPDVISGITVNAGEYYVRIAGGNVNDIQMYELRIDVAAALITCDFDGSGVCDGDDIDMLVAEIAGGGGNLDFDLTGDNLVDLDDRDEWLVQAGAEELPSQNPYLLGDANLDGTVDGQDFLEWNANKFMSIAAWTAGDFNADGIVDGQDFLIWNGNKFQSADGVSAVPEPATALLLVFGVGCCLRRRR